MEKVYLVIGTIWDKGSLETFSHTIVNDYAVHSTEEGARAELYRILEETNKEVQKGKKTSYGIIIPTDLELQLSKCEYANRISCVTIIPGIDEDYENVADCIVEGISRYCLLTNTQKEASYYRKKSEDDISAVLINSNIPPVFSTEIAISKGIKK